MHSFTKLPLDLVEFGTYAFAHAVAMDGEPTVGSGLGTHVREPEEIERIRSAFSASLSMFGGIFAEFDKPCLAFVKFQAEFGEPSAEFLQTDRCLAFALKADHEVRSYAPSGEDPSDRFPESQTPQAICKTRHVRSARVHDPLGSHSAGRLGRANTHGREPIPSSRESDPIVVSWTSP
jgi:hypothetical protein